MRRVALEGEREVTAPAASALEFGVSRRIRMRFVIEIAPGGIVGRHPAVVA